MRNPERSDRISLHAGERRGGEKARRYEVLTTEHFRLPSPSSSPASFLLSAVLRFVAATYVLYQPPSPRMVVQRHLPSASASEIPKIMRPHPRPSDRPKSRPAERRRSIETVAEYRHSIVPPDEPDIETRLDGRNTIRPDVHPLRCSRVAATRAAMPTRPRANLRMQPPPVCSGGASIRCLRSLSRRLGECYPVRRG